MSEEFEDVPIDDQEMSEDEKILCQELSLFGESRRRFLGHAGAAGFSVIAAQVMAEQEVLAKGQGFEDPTLAPRSVENAVKVALKVNGQKKKMDVDSRMTLLDALREQMQMTGTKKGCDHGQCGACTVIVDGERILSCLTLAAQVDGSDVTTVEGLADGGNLHPIQTAFIKYDAFQCGYCTPGQICSSVALLDEAKKGEVCHATDDVTGRKGAKMLTDDEIRERMSGNLCRCGAYPGILKAIKEVQSGKAVAQSWDYYRKEADNESV